MRPSYVPKDIEDYEERIFAGLTFRQLGFGVLALIFGLGFYLLITFALHLSMDMGILGCIGISGCIFYLGWAKWQGTRPISDRIEAMGRFFHLKQIVIYSNEARYFKDKEDFYAKKEKRRKPINERSCDGK